MQLDPINEHFNVQHKNSAESGVTPVNVNSYKPHAVENFFQNLYLKRTTLYQIMTKPLVHII